MKLYASIILLFSTSFVCGVWTVSNIVNDSDIQLNTAVRTNRKQEEVVVQSVTNTLQQTNESNTLRLGKKSSFGSSGSCKLKGVMASGKKITIAFRGDPVNRVANGRADNRSDLTELTQTSSRRAVSNMSSSKVARVILHTEDGDDELIAHAGYEKDNQKFTLHLSGAKGLYTGALKKVS